MGRYTPEAFPRVGEPALQEYLYREYLRISSAFMDIPEDTVASLAALTAAIALKADITALATTNANVATNTSNIATNTANIASNTAAILLRALIASPTFTGLITTGGQIKFPATDVPSADPNTLDDYEEADYTPTVTAGSGTFTSASATGRYTKIGRMVFVALTVTVTTVGTASGAIVVTLPFTTSALPVRQIIIGRDSVLGKILACVALNSTSTMNILNYDNTSAIAAGTNYYVTGWYMI